MTTGYPGNETGSSCWLGGIWNIMQKKQADSLDCGAILPPPTPTPTRVGPGDLGRQRAAGYCGFAIQATSCSVRGSSAPATPAVCSQPPGLFYHLEIILQSATEAIPSSEVGERNQYGGGRGWKRQNNLRGLHVHLGRLETPGSDAPRKRAYQVASTWEQCPDI